MSGLLLFRKSSSSLFHRRLAVTALTHFFSSSPQPSYASSFSSVSNEFSATNNSLFSGVRGFGNSFDHTAEVCKLTKTRALHSGRILQAQGYAVADFSDDDKKGAADEGLEISKLGIHNEIVSSLAKKGITRLFPIQVLPCV